MARFPPHAIPFGVSEATGKSEAIDVLETSGKSEVIGFNRISVSEANGKTEATGVPVDRSYWCFRS